MAKASMSVDDMYAAISRHNVVPNVNEIARMHEFIHAMIDINNPEIRGEVC